VWRCWAKISTIEPCIAGGQSLIGAHGMVKEANDCGEIHGACCTAP
jgi:hypothetical protein